MMTLGRINKMTLKRALRNATGCGIQYKGWPCGTCFFNFSDYIFDNKDWQSLLYFRGDYKKTELNNFPDDWEERIKKIYKIAITFKNRKMKIRLGFIKGILEEARRNAEEFGNVDELDYVNEAQEDLIVVERELKKKNYKIL